MSSGIPVLRQKKPTEASTVVRKQVRSGEGFAGKQGADMRHDENLIDSKSPNTARESGSRPAVGPSVKASFLERARKLKEQNQNKAQQKPEWRGASGRATVVSPVEDDVAIPPLRIPRKSSKRVASRQNLKSPGAGVGGSGPETGVASPGGSDHTNRSTIRKVPSNGQNTPPDLTSSTSYSPQPFSATKGYPSPPPENTYQPSVTQGPGPDIARAYPSTPQAQKQDSVDSVEREFREAYRDVSFAGGFPAGSKEPYIQPPSRFSVTTYAPSTAQPSPRQSLDTDRPPMPTPPQNYTISVEQSPIANRQQSRFEESPKVTQRKAVSASSPTSVGMPSNTRGNASRRVSDVSKSLPKSPAEVQASAKDLIASLEAQLENLAIRRTNITKSIRQMTELMPTDSLTASAAVLIKREQEKKKVEVLKAEEAEIKQQEHELGLRLHRAWKRRDNNAMYESTGLWVKRINA